MPKEDFERFTLNGSFIRSALEKLSNEFKEYNRGFGLAYQLGCLTKSWIKSKGHDVYTRLYEPKIDGNFDFMDVRFNYLEVEENVELEETK